MLVMAEVPQTYNRAQRRGWANHRYVLVCTSIVFDIFSLLHVELSYPTLIIPAVYH